MTSNGLLLEEIFLGGFIATGTWSPRLSGYSPKRQPFPFLHLWKQVSGKKVVSSSEMNRRSLLFTQGASEPACVSGLSCGIQETCFVCWQVCLSMSCELSGCKYPPQRHELRCASLSSTGDTPDSLTSFSPGDFMHTWTCDL